MNMFLLPSGLLGLIYTSVFVSTTSALQSRSSSGAFSLSDDFTNIIPSCAQQCFISFVQANFPATVCSTSPSLECLCSHNSTGGYTVGEGAVQCITSEDEIGACKGENSTETVVMQAYEMCLGQPSALPNTHATISATLIIQSSNPSVVLVDTTYTESAVTTSSSTSLTTSVATPHQTPAGITTATGSPSIPTSVSSTGTPTSQASQVSQSSQASHTAAAAAAASSGSLTTPQIAGIAVGSVGAVVLAIVALLAFSKCRRRRREEIDRDSDFFPFQMEEPKPTLPDKSQGPTNQLPPSQGGPYYSPDQIGLAISPGSTPRKQIPDAGQRWKHSSNLLPEKPALEVQVPTRKELPLSFPAPPTYAQQNYISYDPRESSMTQFEEEPYSPIYDGTNAFQSHSRNASTERLSNTYRQNGMQRQQLPRLLTVPPTMVRPLEILRNQQPNFSQPIHPVTASSSVYSDLASLPSARNNPASWTTSDHTGWRPQPQNQGPNFYKSYRSTRRERRDSMGSATSIESLAGPDYADVGRNTGLYTIPATPNSAVSQEGKSPKGVSPVTYPDPSSFGHPAYRRAPPPPQPDFTKTFTEDKISQARLDQERKRRISKSTMTSQPQQIRADSALSVRSDASSLAMRRARPTPTLNLGPSDDPFVTQPGSLRARNPDQPTDPRGLMRQQADNRRNWPKTPEVTSPSGVHLTPKLIGNDLYLHVG